MVKACCGLVGRKEGKGGAERTHPMHHAVVKRDNLGLITISAVPFNKFGEQCLDLDGFLAKNTQWNGIVVEKNDGVGDGVKNFNFRSIEFRRLQKCIKAGS